jgi:hypothetical protein
MPINYLEVRSQVKEMGEVLRDAASETQDQLLQVRELLLQYTDQAARINQTVNLARDHRKSIRCALPFKETLTIIHEEPDVTVPTMHLLAGDGSQIFPDRHDVTEFGLVNVGIIHMILGDSTAPTVTRASRLLYPGLGGAAYEDITEDLVSFLRDVDERVLLGERLKQVRMDYAEAHHGEMLPAMLLVDGPLELFGEPRNERRYKSEYEHYFRSLGLIQQRQGSIAGYIDKPRSALLVRTLELMETSQDLLTDGHQEPPRMFPQVTDIGLFSDRLKPGQRTAVFQLASSGADDFQRFDPAMRLFFFYINVGYYQRDGTSMNVFARVEIPGWVADAGELVALLHKILLQQCRALGTHPYPYLLHRAHEIAIVKHMEKDEVSRLITAELMSKGVVTELASQKALNKLISST